MALMLQEGLLAEIHIFVFRLAPLLQFCPHGSVFESMRSTDLASGLPRLKSVTWSLRRSPEPLVLSTNKR